MGRLLLWSSVTLVVLVVALVIAAPWLVRAAVPEAFARFGLVASASGGRFNPLRAEITVEGFTLGDSAQPALSLDELGMGIGLRALAGGRLELKRLRVKGVDANSERLMELWKRLGADSSPASGGGLPFELDDVELADVRLVSVGERIGHDVRITHLAIGNPAGLLTSGKSQLALRGAIGAGSVDLALELHFDGGTLEGAGTYHVDDVPLHGWARLGDAGADPLVAGSVSGRGDVRVRFESTDDALDLILDGPVGVNGFALAVAPVDAERGDASWKGQLALQWAPAMPTPNVRGEGSLEVETLHIAVAPAKHGAIHADLSDVSWRGNFDWKGAIVAQGGVVGTRAEIRDASNAQSAWTGRAENFSWRAHAESPEGSGTLGLTMEDINLSRLDASIGVGDAAAEVAVVKIAIDELRTTRSGGLVLGVAGASSVAVTVQGADPREIEVNALTARGMSGDADGALHVASVQAESAKYSDGHAQRTLRIDGIELASVGLGATGLMGADQIHLTSARVQQPSIDAWVSGVEVERVHADGDGRFGAGRVTIARTFQSPTDGLSWQLSALAVDGIDGNVEDTTRIARVELASLSIGQGDTSWDASSVYAAELAVSSTGDLEAKRLGLDSLERRQTSSGDLRVSKLEAKTLGIEGGRAALEGATSAAIEFRSPHGVDIATEGVSARGLSGDRSSGVAIERLAVTRGSVHSFDGTRIEGSALAGRTLAVGGAGEVKVASISLAKLSGALPDSMSLDVEGAQMHAFERTAGGALSTRKASIDDARLAQGNGAAWALSRLSTNGLEWRRESGLGIDDANLETLSHTHGNARLLLGKALQARKLELRSPADVSVAGFSAASMEGGSGTAAWKVDSIDAERFERRLGDGNKLDRLATAKVAVSDSHNGARLSLDNARAKDVRVSELEELAAGSVSIDAVRLESEKPDWPPRLALDGLHLEKASLQPGAAIDVEEIVASEPYLVIAQSPDNAWMWPPLPGGGDAHEAKSRGGTDIRIARFSTRGPARLLYIDNGTEPAFEFTLNPLVVALENLDTRHVGSKSRFRIRGTGGRLADVRVSGALTRRVDAFDLELELDAKGTYLPDFNPYVTRREPIVVSDGWGDVDGKIHVEQHRLSGNVDVLMSGLEIRIKDRVPLLARLDPADFPVRTALALLKDSNGNIRVDVPLSAQTSRAGFDILDTFRDAFAQTVETAGKVAEDLPGKTMDTALSMIEDTVSLLPGVDAEDYSPIAFPPGSNAIPAESLVYLGQLADRFEEHSALALALCGRAVPLDSDALGKDDEASSIAELFDQAGQGVYNVYAADHEGLLSLARSRAGAVRRHLRDLHDVANQRLASCDAKVDTSPEQRPRVEFDIKTPAREGGLLDFL